MNDELMLGARALAKSAARRIRRPAGRRVECLSGSLWITQDGDPRDVVLAPGEGFAFDRDGGAIVSALADARYLLLDACAAPAQ